MTERKILVIDDDSAMVRLTALILRRSGYKVSVASNAEEAFSSLRTLRPDLILVDLRLPGIKGLDFTRQVRQYPWAKNTLILLMTAFSEADIESAATEAGCDGYLRKPFSPEGLTAFVHRHLRRESGPSSNTRATPPPRPDPAHVFLEYASSSCRTLLESPDPGVVGSPDSRLLRQIAAEASQYGFGSIPPMVERATELMDGFYRNPHLLQECLTSLSAELERQKASADARAFSARPRGLNAKHIVIAGFDAVDTDALRALAGHFGASAQTVPSGGRLVLAALQGCDIAIVRVGGLAEEPLWLFPGLAETAIIFAGDYRGLMSIDPKVLSRAREILVDDWRGKEAHLRIGLVLSHELAPVAAGQDEQLSVLVVDDDPDIGRLIRLLVENLGMQCFVASDGHEALNLLAGCRPDAAIIDLNLPGRDGFGVMEMIRARIPWLRIMLLTARDAESDVIRGFQLGADDYLTKPFSHLELVARLKRLLPTRRIGVSAGQ
jgi:DNA-binding response OmpR family regulator